MHNFTDRQDIWEEAHEAGVNEGLERGIEQGIGQMLRAGKTPEQIADFCGYELSKVKEVQQRMLIEA